MTGRHRVTRPLWHPWRRFKLWRLYAIPLEWALVVVLLLFVILK